MNERDIQRLLYIQKYCRMIAQSLSRFGADIKTFTSDSDYFNSVSMSIMQIGEHAKSLSTEFTDSTRERIPWHAIRGIRNMFAHEYITMDSARIWETACNEIPKLLAFCDDVLEKNNICQTTSAPEQKPSIRERLRMNQTISENHKPAKEKKKSDPEI